MKLDEALTTYQELIMEMSRKVRAMHVLALEILRSGDKEKALHVIKLDEFVNRYEEEINDQAQDVLALLSPVATDLRVVIAGIKIASDLERIGDYAKNIAEYMIKNGALQDFVADRAEEIAACFLRMLDETMQAYQQRNVQAAFTIPEEDEQINTLFEKMIDSLEETLQKGTTIMNVVPMVAMLRNFERSGDHTKNICEHLIYQVKGQHIDFG